MHKDFYHQPKQNFKVDITLPKFLVIVITVMAFFVIPVQVISLSKSKQDNSISASNTVSYTTPSTTKTETKPSTQPSGRVAGESTTGTDKSNTSGGLDFSSKSTQYAVLGVFFMSISFISLAYLFVSESQKKEVDIL